MLQVRQGSTVTAMYPEIWQAIQSESTMNYQHPRVFTAKWFSTSSLFDRPESIVLDETNQRYGLVNLSSEGGFVGMHKQHDILAELCQSWGLSCSRVESINKFVGNAAGVGNKGIPTYRVDRECTLR